MTNVFFHFTMTERFSRKTSTTEFIAAYRLPFCINYVTSATLLSVKASYLYVLQMFRH